MSGTTCAPTSVMVTGIGGQGIQLLSKTLALGATLQGRHAMLSAEVGGEMRGGPSLASVVIGDGPVRALPILEHTDAVILSHHRHSERALSRIVPGGLLLINSSVVDEQVIPAGLRLVRIPAQSIATGLGAPQANGLVLLGAFARLTGVVEHEHLAAAMEQLLPPYRRQHVPANIEAMLAGAAAADAAAQADPVEVPA